MGTGVGVGLVINGKTVHGLVHPEGGHLPVARMPGDSFAGTCPFHGACIEGLCSTGALAARKGISPSELPGLDDNDPVWDACAFYLASLCANLILIASPERIAIGGGVLKRSILYPKIRRHVKIILNDYIKHDNITSEKIDNFICPSFWGMDAGIVGKNK